MSDEQRDDPFGSPDGVTLYTVAGEALTPGVARQAGERSECCDADVWVVPWYSMTTYGVRWRGDVRLCEECGEDR